MIELHIPTPCAFKGIPDDDVLFTMELINPELKFASVRRVNGTNTLIACFEQRPVGSERGTVGSIPNSLS